MLATISIINRVSCAMRKTALIKVSTDAMKMERKSVSAIFTNEER
jgi:hypothetical protein